MNTKKQFFIILLCFLASASIFCSDEFKEKTSGKQDKSPAKIAPAVRILDQKTAIAFMVNTVLRVAKKGNVNQGSEVTWQNKDNTGRKCTVIIPNDADCPDHYTFIHWSKNPYEKTVKLFPTDLKIIEENRYNLVANSESMSLQIKPGELAQQEAFFKISKDNSAVTFSKITTEGIKANDFLEKQHISYVKLYTEKEKSTDK